MTNTRAAIYCRISLDRSGESLGVQRQEEACRELCQQRGWDVARVYLDNDISATKGRRRPGFEDLLATVGSFDVIVVWHTDRLVRLTRELERVIDLGVDVHAVQAGHLDLSNPAGRAVARTITAWAQYEGEIKGQRQKLAARQKADSGTPSWPIRPFGYNSDGTKRPEEAAVLEAAYHSIIAGETVSQIARNWERDGILTTRGNPWRRQAVSDILRSVRNAGLRTYGGEVVGRGAWEPIVPEATYRAAMRVLKAPGRGYGVAGTGRTAAHLLSGILRCSQCGGAARCQSRGDYSVYVCIEGKCVTAQEEYADAKALRELLRYMPLTKAAWAGLRIEGMGSEDGDTQAVRDELEDLAQRELDLAEAYAAGAVTLQQMMTANKATAQRRAELEASIASSNSTQSWELASLSGDPEIVAENWQSRTLAKRRAVIEAAFSKATMHPRRHLRPQPPGVLTFLPRGFSSAEEADAALESVLGQTITTTTEQKEN
ncbi:MULTISPECIES: recombinase family protein [unclassified Luteococcus]|uniref:recombinase family protein n=1 Tax=unclassified Luteococcus TaxID=2639923 RepID=UPI00313CE35F